MYVYLDNHTSTYKIKLVWYNKRTVDVENFK